MNNLYIRLAWTNIKNSRQFYLPYLLTGILSGAMFYIMMAMRYNNGLDAMPGSRTLKSIMTLGTCVVGIFVCIFLFYTNSFIIKRRKKELGVYNILGMEKRHIAKELTLETLFAAVISIAGGLLIGILFNKLMVMLLYRMIGLSSPIQFEISMPAASRTTGLFLFIYLATLLYNMLQVRLAKPVELLHGGNVGEREPRTKLLMTLTGIICIGIGYYIAITTESPLKALTMFFIAVILVIIGTYSLFTAGSIAFLKALRKNKNFYYQTNHFIAVSGMIYRMKQNAVGLANICILSTMVLVMVSTTVCLYVGANDELMSRYPTEISVRGTDTAITDHSTFEQEIEDTIRESGRSITAKSAFCAMDVSVVRKEAEHAMEFISPEDTSKPALLYIMAKQSYETAYPDSENSRTLAPLSNGELTIIGTPLYTPKDLTLFGKAYRVKESLAFADDSDENYMGSMIGGMYYILLPDNAALEELFTHCQKNFKQHDTQYIYHLAIDIDGSREEKTACDNAVQERIKMLSQNEKNGFSKNVSAEFRELNRSYFYVQNGGFLFLGIFLGSLFLMVTVLIIYYKQISEGYDDRSRFEIMEKVGMSNREVRTAISTQIRLVFLLPIVTAAIHVTAAFPMIKRLLMIMNLFNGTLFAFCLAGTILVFSAIYLLVFLLTSRSYYKIVGNQLR